MYIRMVITLMFVLPIASVLIEIFVTGHAAQNFTVIGKWFVFWAVGIRLLIAGLRQIIQPQYTAETILGIKGTDSLLLVRELGFATTAIGCAATASLVAHGWSLPLAFVGAIFYGLAGVNHVAHKGRNKLQNVAMISDILIAIVLLAFCLSALAL